MELALTPGMRRVTFHLNGIKIPTAALEMASGSITFSMAAKNVLDSYMESPDYRLLSVLVSAWWYKQVEGKDVVNIKYGDDFIAVYHKDGMETIKFDFDTHNGLTISYLSNGSLVTTLEEYTTFRDRYLVVSYNKEDNMQAEVFWSECSNGIPHRYRVDWGDEPIFFGTVHEIPRMVRNNMFYRIEDINVGGAGEILQITDTTETLVTTNGKCNREQVWNEKFIGQGQLVIEEKIKFCDYDHNNPESNDGFRTIITEGNAYVFAHPKEIGAVVLTID